ncbi:PREDICTED: structural maintenance of chromosomes protein 1B-like [Chrysochloris asiatica]|uniref:Structural maintenance of chromosomes protein 1B-like n=1 Tax=Chrysochloris asiatica TaxID=185453 RepID=A0A9B0X3N9_CHRAS|nr:PREDICTED: structural maintenance of chromosomes protein 1B-like [Chrysochloris asiatica]
MGHLHLLLVENFKSWRGHQVIGPFKKFTCIIGPNGSGKSNIMDALSFAMGENPTNLRVRNIQELIHGAHIGKPNSSFASVTIVYVEESGEEKTFARIIRGEGSEFRFDDKPVSRTAYLAELEKIGIILQGRNCLGFQGTTESMSLKNPKEITQFFEEISTSGKLTGEYEEKKKKLQQAEEDTHFYFNKKRRAAAERKRAKLQKEEAERYQSLLEELEMNKIQLQLFQLYHNERKIRFLSIELEHANWELGVTKESLSHQEDVVKAKKREHGMLTRQVQQTEKELKEVGKLQEDIEKIQTSLKHKRSEKRNILLNCKVQDIKVVLLQGSLDDIIDVEAVQSDKDVEVQRALLLQQIASQEDVLLKTATPNLRAVENLRSIRDKLKELTEAFEANRNEARICRQQFEQVKRRRYDLFNQCFEHVSVSVDQIYKKLCRNSSAQAFLSPENPEEPYLEGIGYSCVVPGKRFMLMDNLSGGEKCVATLALLFAVHSFRPAPFFVLDEMDTALDNASLGKVSTLPLDSIRAQSGQLTAAGGDFPGSTLPLATLAGIRSCAEKSTLRGELPAGVPPAQMWAFQERPGSWQVLQSEIPSGGIWQDYCTFSRVLTLDISQYPDTDGPEDSNGQPEAPKDPAPS